MEKKKTSKKGAKKSTSKKIVAKKEVKEVAKEVVKDTKKVVETVKETTKKNDYSLFKVLVLSILLVVVLTWIIPAGTYTGEEFQITEITRTGINELFLSIFYGANYYLIQIILLLAVGLFYGIISKNKGYNGMVNKIANLWKGKEKVFVLVHSLVIALMTSVLTHPFAILVFIPLIYSVAKKLNLSKLSTVMTTFGAMLVGLMGTTYGTYGLEYINSYMGTKMDTMLLVRFGILALGYIALNIFVILMEKKNSYEKVEEIYVADSEKGNSVGYFILFALLLVITLLGYVAWETIFTTTVFTDFHTWLTQSVNVGGYPIFGYILGNITALGSWDLFNISAILLFTTVIIKFTSRIKWDEVFDRAVDGIKKMVKPIVLLTFAYSMFVICYWSGMTNTVINFFNSNDGFIPTLNAIGNALATFFHVDFGYSGFALGAYYASKFADKVNQILVIMTSMNGIISFIAPTSVIMLVGLSLSKVSYKEWFKYIWKFVVAMLILLFIIYSII